MYKEFFNHALKKKCYHYSFRSKIDFQYAIYFISVCIVIGCRKRELTVSMHHIFLVMI